MDFDILRPETAQQEQMQTEPARVDVQTIAGWNELLKKYKAGKAHLEQRIISAEQWWKLRHWSEIRAEHDGVEPASGWLVNTILSKHSDAMDAYPEAIVLPREEADKQEAKNLSDILPVVLKRNGFRQVWSDAWWYKLKSGTACYGVFWDSNALGGLGDIRVDKVDILNLFWEPGVQDLSESECVFYVNLENRKNVEASYPGLDLSSLPKNNDVTLNHYIFDDSINTSDKVNVIDVYYRKNGVMHYAKYCGSVVLFSTENDPELAQTGLYAHGEYPFILDPLFPEEGYPHCGYGYVDLAKDPQKIIDILNGCFVKSSIAASNPRWFIRQDGGVNEDEFADFRKNFVHVDGRLDTESLVQIQTAPMPANAINFMQMKIDEMKQVTGNRDVNNGGASSQMAASALSLLQEAGNGLSRDMIDGSYRAFERIVTLCIELIRQYYDLPRTFRIIGNAGQEQFVSYDNSQLQGQPMQTAFGDTLMRQPVFDLDVVAQSESRYTKAAYNELAIQLYQLGAFNPQQAEQTLLMLDMMDFKGKDELIRKIQQQAMMQQQLQMYQQMAIALAQKYEPEMAQGLAQQAMGAAMGGAMQMGAANPGKPGAAAEVGEGRRENVESKEHPFVQRARQQAQDGSKPR